LAPGGDLITCFACAEGACCGCLRRRRRSPWPPLSASRASLLATPPLATLPSCCPQASLTDGLASTKSNVDDKSADLREVEQKLAQQEEDKDEVKEKTADVEAIKEEIKKEVLAAATSHRSSFYFLFLMVLALAGVGYNRYRKIMKSHYL